MNMQQKVNLGILAGMIRLSYKTLGILLLVTGIIELIIIAYNAATGAIHVSSPVGFAARFLFGTAVSAPFAVAAFLLDIRLITFLERRISWEDRPLARALSEIALSCAIAFPVAYLLTGISHFIRPYHNGYLYNAFNNALIVSVVNILFTAVLEGVLAVLRHRVARQRMEQIERETALARLEVLKNQLSPHFLFNSMNVLSSLVAKDPQRAQQCIEIFSSLYRYVLEVIEQPLVPLRGELDFARAYLSIQELRFEGSIAAEFLIPESAQEMLVPPLALQTLLENVFKHNTVSGDQPIRLMVHVAGDLLVVENTLRTKRHQTGSTGIGQKNLLKRYELVGDRLPTFVSTGSLYVARLPLIQAE
jgi:two-component system, LytTR family, sensor kinase